MKKKIKNEAKGRKKQGKGEGEERRENEAEALRNRDYNQPLHRSSFGVLHSSFG